MGIHHGGPNLNQIDHGVDVWAVALLIIYCVNGGHLGEVEVDVQLRLAYNHAVCDGNIILMQTAFKEYYDKMFVADFGMGYLAETRRLVKEKKISPVLCDLLSMTEVLRHEWFKNMDEDDADDYAENLLEIVEE